MNQASYAAGTIASAFLLDGGDDFVSVAHDASLDLQEHTIEAWIQVSYPIAGTFSGIVVKQAPDNFERNYYLGIQASGQVHYSITTQGIYRTIDSDTVIPDGIPTHVAASFDGSTMRIYIDGVERASETFTPFTPDTTSQPLRIGWTNEPHPRFFPGWIDDVRVYDRALAASELHSDKVLLDLADVVGAGNGLGTGTPGHGVDPTDGSFGASPANPGLLDVGDGVYHPVGLPFVDGVFVPFGETQLTSNPAHTAAFTTDNHAYDWVEFGPNDPEETENFSVVDGVDYASGDNTMIGLHANSGITFDLEEIRAVNSSLEITGFAAVTGVALGVGGDADLRIYIDGTRVYEFLDMPTDTAIPIDLAIGPSARFLTLVATDGPSDSFLADRVVIGNPRLLAARAPTLPGLSPRPLVLLCALMAGGGSVALGRRERPGRRLA